MKALLAIVVLVFAFCPSKVESQCQACESLVSVMNSWVQKNHTVASIEKKLDTLCGILPSMQNTCVQIIDSDVQGIVSFLSKYGNPNAVCKKMGVCAGLSLQRKVSNDDGEGGDNYVCGYCRTFFDFIGMFFGGMGVTGDSSGIAGTLEYLCAAFPSETMCSYGIYNLVPLVMQYMGGASDTESFCESYGLCEAGMNGFDDYNDEEEDYYDDEEEQSLEDNDAEEYEDESYEQYEEESSEDYDEGDYEDAGAEDWEDDGWKIKRSENTKLHPDDTCNYCTSMVSWAGYYIKSNQEVEKVEEIFEKYVCANTVNLEQMCSTMIYDFGMVAQYVAEEQSPKNICYEMELCQQRDELYDNVRNQIMLN